eukprot:10601480-Heterocapsa_arctica.AAC.1
MQRVLLEVLDAHDREKPREVTVRVEAGSLLRLVRMLAIPSAEPLQVRPLLIDGLECRRRSAERVLR